MSDAATRSVVDRGRAAGSTARMSLQSAIRWLVPREDHFYTFLEGQAEVAHEAAVALHRWKDGEKVSVVCDAVLELEHKGDKIVHEMEEALAKTFVTPIDREDLHRLSVELDDILDRANGAIRAASLNGVPTPTEPMNKLMDLLIECTTVVKASTPLLRKNKYAEITEAASSACSRRTATRSSGPVSARSSRTTPSTPSASCVRRTCSRTWSARSTHASALAIASPTSR